MRVRASAALGFLALVLLVSCSGRTGEQSDSCCAGFPAHTTPIPSTSSGDEAVCLASAAAGTACPAPSVTGAGEVPTPGSRPGTASAPPRHPPPTPTPEPAQAPGRDVIALETLRDGNSEIYLLDATTGLLANLTRHPDDDRSPAWRPDGGAIAFESHRDGNWEIYVLSLASGQVARLTSNLAYDGGPAWSPDGSRLAFESYRDGNLEIYTIRVDGTDLVRVTDHEAGDYGPAWSPDGLSIAFTSWRDGNKEIYVAPSAGGSARNWTDSPADQEDPAWARDGTFLAYVCWRDVDEGARRDAEICRQSTAAGPVEPLTDNAWPDVDPAIDVRGQLVWAAYEPGPPFETYDPYRPGRHHLYRSTSGGIERLTGGERDDRRPAPAPPSVGGAGWLPGQTDAAPSTAMPTPAEEEGQIQTVEVPGVLAGKDGPPILVNDLVLPSLLAWKGDVLAATGWDFLHETLGSWRPIDSVRKRAMYAYDYGFLSWHKTGRALDLALEYKVDGVDQLLIVREDLGESVFWRLYLRTAKQDGTQGEPLRDNPWLRWWWIVPGDDPEAYEAGGKRLPIPQGYYADVTGLAKRHGWERIASYAIESDYHWKTDTNGTEYWHYERTDGLTWWQAMSQVYEPEVLVREVGWEAGLKRAQTEEMMRSKGVPTPAP